ncbi:MAG: hypothetical protein GXO36_00810, partial [Chloroflexi bacterium]|nr:hypothetical protein [Chloroflexota bacterium]
MTSGSTRRKLGIVAGLALLWLLGLALVPTYGEAWDDYSIFLIGWKALWAYASLFTSNPPPTIPEPPNGYAYGAWPWMLAVVLMHGIRGLTGHSV